MFHASLAFACMLQTPLTLHAHTHTITSTGPQPLRAGGIRWRLVQAAWVIRPRCTDARGRVARAPELPRNEATGNWQFLSLPSSQVDSRLAEAVRACSTTHKALGLSVLYAMLFAARQGYSLDWARFTHLNIACVMPSASSRTV